MEKGDCKFYSGKRKEMKFNLSKKGLTLVELLIVIGIIAVLAGIIWVFLGPVREKGRLIHCVNNFRQLYLALEIYRNDWNGVNAEAARNFDDLALPLTPYMVTGRWPFRRVIWIWGNQDLWLCPAKNPADRMKLSGGVFIDYWYRVWPRWAIFFPPNAPEEQRNMARRTVKELEEEFIRRRGKFVLLYDGAHGFSKHVAPGAWTLEKVLFLRLNGQIQVKEHINHKPEEW